MAQLAADVKARHVTPASGSAYGADVFVSPTEKDTRRFEPIA